MKSLIINFFEAFLRLSSNMIRLSSNFPHKLLLTNRQVSNLRKAFAYNLSTDTKLSKIHLSKMIQSGRFLSEFLGPILKTGSVLMKKIFQSLAQGVLARLIAVTLVADAGVHKKILGSGSTTLIISNEEMEDIMKTVKSLEDSGLLSKGVG